MNVALREGNLHALLRKHVVDAFLDECVEACLLVDENPVAYQQVDARRPEVAEDDGDGAVRLEHLASVVNLHVEYGRDGVDE